MLTIGEFMERYGVEANTRKGHARIRAARARRAEDEARFRGERGDTEADRLEEQMGRYLSRIPQPEDVPSAFGIVHSRIAPGTTIGAKGFRIWAQRLDDTDPPIEPCPCGWARELGRHFRVARP
jgi:hypothetical protein